MVEEKAKEAAAPEEKAPVKELAAPETPIGNKSDTDAPAPDTPEEPKLECGFTVGKSEDKMLVWTIGGKKVGLVELMGLAHLAQKRIDAIYEVETKSGTAAVGMQLQGVMETITRTLGLLREIIAAVEESKKSLTDEVAKIRDELAKKG